MAVSDTRQRYMPSRKDREMGQPLAYPEAVLLSHPEEQQFKGEVTLFSVMVDVSIDMHFSHFVFL